MCRLMSRHCTINCWPEIESKHQQDDLESMSTYIDWSANTDGCAAIEKCCCTPLTINCMPKATCHNPNTKERRSNSSLRTNLQPSQKSSDPPRDRTQHLLFLSSRAIKPSSNPSSKTRTPLHPSMPSSRPPDPSHQQSSNTTRKQAGTFSTPLLQPWLCSLSLYISCCRNPALGPRCILPRNS